MAITLLKLGIAGIVDLDSMSVLVAVGIILVSQADKYVTRQASRRLDLRVTHGWEHQIEDGVGGVRRG